MTSGQPNEASTFNAARRIESSDKRHSFLNEACGNDTGLRERIDKLLAASVEESQFLEQPAPESMLSTARRAVLLKPEAATQFAQHYFLRQAT